MADMKIKVNPLSHANQISESNSDKSPEETNENQVKVIKREKVEETSKEETESPIMLDGSADNMTNPLQPEKQLTTEEKSETPRKRKLTKKRVSKRIKDHTSTLLS